MKPQLVKNVLILTVILFSGSCLYSQSVVNIRIDAAGEIREISPFIYGKNNSLSDNPSKPLSEADWRRLRDLGITLRYPSYRQGLQDLL